MLKKNYLKMHRIPNIHKRRAAMLVVVPASITLFVVVCLLQALWDSCVALGVSLRESYWYLKQICGAIAECWSKR